MLDIKLLHPITLTQPLVLEIPCHKISREHRLQGGPSLEEVERAILERTSSSSTASSSRQGQKNATTSTQNEDSDIVYAEVKTLSVKASADVESKYGVYRLPVERKRGVFGPERDDRIRRGRRTPEEEKKEDEEILGRLLEWKGFYGGFEGLQEAYRPLSSALPARAQTSSDQSGRSASTPAPEVKSLSAAELAEQKEAEKRSLEERLSAEREYWRKRREVEKTIEKEGESSTESAPRSGPSPTLLQRLLKGESENAAEQTPSTESSTSTAPPTKTSTADVSTSSKEPAPLNKAQARLVEQARQRAREESSPSPFKNLLGGGKPSQQSQPKDESSTKGFKPDTSKNEEEGLLESWAQWFKKRV